MGEIAVEFAYSIKTRRRFHSYQYISTFGKIYGVITVCKEDIYGRYCIQ